MAATRWSPRRERERQGETLALVATVGLHDSVWVLCAHEETRSALEDRAAREHGGVFARFVDWNVCTQLIEDRLNLPFAGALGSEARVAIIERALSALAGGIPALSAPLENDPFGVAMGLLPVVDDLRRCGWNGVYERAREVVGADALVEQHVGVLAALVRAVEDPVETQGAIDLVTRMQRLTASLTARGGSVGEALPRVVRVEGVDHLAQSERAFLDALALAGCMVDLAPWLDGAVDHSLEESTAETLLDALDVGARRCATDRDEDFMVVRAGDFLDETEGVARWIVGEIEAGSTPDTIAVWLPDDGASLARMLRALERYDLDASGRGSLSTRQSPLWQAVRSSLKLGWTGVDVIDLATVLAAPGSSILRSVRDKITAQLRKSLPAGWASVRLVVEEATTPTPQKTDDTTDEALTDEESIDPEWAAKLLEARGRVSTFIDQWETAGPIRTLSPFTRVTALRALLDFTLERFAAPEVFGNSFDSGGVLEAWLGAAQSIRAACSTVIDRWAASGAPPLDQSPERFLCAVEALLGTTTDGEWPTRRGGVQLIVGASAVTVRPKTLVITGFHHGRFPTSPPRPMLLGPLERARLTELSPDLASLCDDATLSTLAHRETLRVLALPTRRLVVVSPARGIDTKETELSAALGDLYSRLPPEREHSRKNSGPLAVSRWSREKLSTHARAQALDAISLLGDGNVSDAARIASPLAARSPAWRALFTARFRPDLRFDLGALLRRSLDETVFHPRGIESLLSCKYKFMAQELLGLRPLPLAARPSISRSDETRVARAALTRIDEAAKEGVEPEQLDLEYILEQALTAVIPWHDRPESKLRAEELVRTVREFLKRYVSARRKWGVVEPGTDCEQEKPIEITVDGRRKLKLLASSTRIESVVVQGAPNDNERQTVVVQLSRSDTSKLAALRDGGFDVDGALVPSLVERTTGLEVSALVRLSLDKPVGDALTREPEPESRSLAAALTNPASETIIKADGDGVLDEHLSRLEARIADAFDAVDRDDGDYSPHSEEQKKSLDKLGKKTCDYCPLKLSCRFATAGEI